MLTRRTRVRLALATLLTGVLAATGVMLIRGPDVFAAPPGCENTPDSTECGLPDSTTLPGGGGGAGGAGNPGGGGSGSTACVWRGNPVACSIPGGGEFNANDGCYYRVAQPQPETTPEGQTAYFRSCIDTGGAQETVFLEAPPDLFVPDPADIALNILATISFPRPEIQLAPANGGVLGLPVWMRIANDGAWATVERSATEAGLTVTLVAAPRRAVWTMGDGSTVVCTSRGDAWTSEQGKSPSKSCGYPMAGGNAAGYQVAGDYEITVSTFWEITWSTTNQDGVLPDVQSPVSQVTYVVDELQVVNR